MIRRTAGRQFYQILMLLMVMMLLMPLYGCGSKVVPQVFTYEENVDGTLTITGLTEKGKRDSVLSIPEELDGKRVTAVGREAFRGNEAVTEVHMADSVTTVLENAFLSCTHLEEITFSANLQEVGTNAVKNTPWQKRNLEEHGEIIVNHILMDVAVDITEYQVPEGVTRIASGVFYCNSSIRRISLPDSLEYIDSYAFADCSELSVLEVPRGVKEIGYEAFLNLSQVLYAGEAQGTPWGAAEVKR